MKSKYGKVSSRNGPKIIPLDYIDHLSDENDKHTTIHLEEDDENDHDEADAFLKATGRDHFTNMNDKNGTEIADFWNSSGTASSLNRNSNFRQRVSSAVKQAFRTIQDDKSSSSSSSSLSLNMTRVRGYIRSNIGISSTTRGYKILAALAIGCSMTIIYVLSTNALQGIQEVDSHFSPHTPSFGGTRNSNHYVQKPDHDNNNDDDKSWYTKVVSSERTSNVDTSSNTDDATIPLTISNIGISTVRSISKQNIENQAGHYIHDPINNPYTSPYYAQWKYSNRTILKDQEQIQYEKKLKLYSEKYGQWNTPFFPSTLVKPNFTTTTPESISGIVNMDLPTSQFPSASWQANTEYVQTFLHEAKSLITRVKEGIYEEYGYGILDITSTLEQNKIIKQRLELFQVLVEDRINVNGNGAARKSINGRNAEEEEEEVIIPAIAYLNTVAWEALIRKLLHSMMTHDVFYAVLIGHTNTYMGNNFQQSSIMEFNLIMEPIFDKLGMTLISRNMGMNATTTNSAMGGSDIYGEADILWHVPDPRSSPETESNIIKETYPMVDFLFRQAILSGSRVPIILSPEHKTFLDEMNQKVWMGNIQPGAIFCEDTYLQNRKIVVPTNKACRFVNCRGDPKMCDKHNSVCWVERSDRVVYQTQDRNVGHQREGYPNVQQQRLEGRKLSMLILHALDEALDRWITKTKAKILPLPDEMWHVSEKYSEVREYVRTSKSGLCGRFLQKIDPRICHIEMHAYTEWTPRVDPIQSRLKTLIYSDIPVADKQISMLEVYSEVALLPPQWKIDDNDTDVHMIAIATNTSVLPTGKDNDKVQVDSDALPKVYSDRDDDVTMEKLFSKPNNDFDDDNVGTNKDNDLGFEDGASHTDDGSGRSVRRLRSDMQRYRSLMTASDLSKTFWTVFNAPIGFCDGSAQSSCNRQGSNKCLLSNYNHYRAGLVAHGQSGKIRMSLPNVRVGIILAKFDWREDNGPRVRYYAPDFVFEYTVNGVHKTMDRMKFLKAGIDLSQDLRIHVLLMDKNFKIDDPAGQTVTIEMEVRSPKAALSPLLLLTHLYYA